MRLPGWLAKLVARIFPFIEWDAALMCEACGRTIELHQGMSEDDMREACEAHDGFFHGDGTR